MNAHSSLQVRVASKPRVLVLLGAFWPGHEATGPNQSFRAFATALADRFEFRVIARDRPFGASKSIAADDSWTDEGFAHFRYCQVSPLSGAVGLARILRETPHDILMMNGFFDREFTLPALVLRRAGLAPRVPAILSTRGEFAGGALALKARRKSIYLHLSRILGLHRDVTLHATSAKEADEVRQVCPWSDGVLVAPNVRHVAANPPDWNDEPSGVLRLAFLGRVSRVKNLDYALKVLAEARTAVTFDIYGPIEDPAYWLECVELIRRLPSNVTVNQMGAIAHASVPTTLATYDLLFLPTRGENFGHAILDALSVGVPLLISDQTPFVDLEREGVGWSLPLSEPRSFLDAIESAARMGPEGKSQMRQRARRLAEQTIAQSDAIRLCVEMLETMLNRDTGAVQWNA
jgi:glycosyltransferase involved in cell wall biosynthesis